MRASRFGRVDAVLRAATGTRFTAAVARIERGGRMCFERAYGATRRGPHAQPVAVDTRFDLASLTKLFVATLALDAVARGRLDLDAPAARWLTQWRLQPHAAITLRDLLVHRSGMDSGADYRTILDRNVVDFTLHAPLLATPGQRVIYSDLGFIALGALLERAGGAALPAQIAACFGRPTLGFRPPARERAAIPATERDGWRGRVQGYVHDEKAYLMGGAAGHAGLFGTAADVAWLTEGYLAPAAGRHASLLPADLACAAVREAAADPTLRRGLGWALKTSDENSCGARFDARSFGHTGFVGTCVWADPHRDLQGVLLTNSVYFGRRDTRDLRAAFYDAIVADLA